MDAAAKRWFLGLTPSERINIFGTNRLDLFTNTLADELMRAGHNVVRGPRFANGDAP